MKNSIRTLGAATVWLVFFAAAFGLGRPSLGAPPGAAEASLRPLEWKFGYDDADRPVLLVDPAGRETRMRYETAEDGRVVRQVIRASDGTEVALELNRAGQRVSMTDAIGKTEYEYDADHRLSAVRRDGALPLSYVHDGEGRLRSVEVGAVVKVVYAYDSLGRLAAIEAPFGTVKYGRDARKAERHRTLPNGVRTVWAYLEDGNLASITHSGPTGEVIADLKYAYRPDGLVREVKERFPDGDRTLGYEYDPAQRLLRAAGPGKESFACSYDEVGNRSEAVASGQAAASVFDWAGRLVLYMGRPCENDAAGNLTRLPGRAEPLRLRYNASNLLAQAAVGGKTVVYGYDGDGLLSRREAPEGKSTYLPDPLAAAWRPLLETRADGATTVYVWEGEAPLAAVSGERVHYFLADHLGSVRCIVDRDGKLVDRLDYDPFGVPRPARAMEGLQPAFAGLFLEPVGTLYVTRARTYVPSLGMFLQADPRVSLPLADPKELPGRVYCGNDPVNFVDATGLDSSPVNPGAASPFDWMRRWRLQAGVDLATRLVAQLSTLREILADALLTWAEEQQVPPGAARPKPFDPIDLLGRLYGAYTRTQVQLVNQFRTARGAPPLSPHGEDRMMRGVRLYGRVAGAFTMGLSAVQKYTELYFKVIDPIGTALMAANPPVYLEERTRRGWEGRGSIDIGDSRLQYEGRLSTPADRWWQPGRIVHEQNEKLTTPIGVYERSVQSSTAATSAHERFLALRFPLGSYYDPGSTTYTETRTSRERYRVETRQGVTEVKPVEPARERKAGSPEKVTIYVTDPGVNNWEPGFELFDDFSEAAPAVVPHVTRVGEILIPMPDDEHFPKTEAGKEALTRLIAAGIIARIEESGLENYEVRLAQNIKLIGGYFTGGIFTFVGDRRQEKVNEFGLIAYEALDRVKSHFEGQGTAVDMPAIVGSNGAKVLTQVLPLLEHNPITRAVLIDGRAPIRDLIAAYAVLGGNIAVINTLGDAPAGNMVANHSAVKKAKREGLPDLRVFRVDIRPGKLDMAGSQHIAMMRDGAEVEVREVDGRGTSPATMKGRWEVIESALAPSGPRARAKQAEEDSTLGLPLVEDPPRKPRPRRLRQDDVPPDDDVYPFFFPPWRPPPPAVIDDGGNKKKGPGGAAIAPDAYFLASLAARRPGGPGAAAGGSVLAPVDVGGVYLGGAGDLLRGCGRIIGIAHDEGKGRIVLLGEGKALVELGPLRLDDVVAIFRLIYEDLEAPWVSIDPDPSRPKGPEMLTRYPPGLEDTFVLWVLFESDRLMKGYGLGFDNVTKAKVTSAIEHYDELSDLRFGGLGGGAEVTPWEAFWIVPGETVKQSIPDGKLTRLGVTLKVNTERRVMSGGKLVPAPGAASSRFAQAFTEWFTRNYEAIGRETARASDAVGARPATVSALALLERIAVVSAAAEHLRDQGVPMPAWMRNHKAPRHPVPRTTPALEVPYHRTRGNLKETVRVYGGVTLGPDPETVKSAAPTPAMPELAGDLWRAVDAAPPGSLTAFEHDGKSYQALSLPTRHVRAPGACRLAEADLTVPLGRGRGLVLRRRFHSFFRPGGSLGDVWTLDLPRLHAERHEFKKTDQGYSFVVGWRLSRPLGGAAAEFREQRLVPEAGRTLLVPSAPGPYLGIATEPGGRKVLLLRSGSQWHFDADGYLIAAFDEGRQVTYHWDAGHRLRRIEARGGAGGQAAITLAYDEASGLLLSAEGTNGEKVEYRYEGGSLISASSAGRTTTYQYTGGLVTGVYHDGKLSRRFEYGDGGTLGNETGPDGVEIAYDVKPRPGGFAVSAAGKGPDGEQRRLEIEYDADLRPVAGRVAGGARVSWEYAADGSVQVTGTAAGETERLRLARDANGEWEVLKLPFAPVFRTRFGADGRVLGVWSGERQVLSQSFSPAGLLESASDGESTLHLKRGADGRLEEAHVGPDAAGEPGREWLKAEMDEAGRLRALRDASGSALAFTYDSEGRVSAVRDDQGGEVGVGWDKEGRIVEVRGAGATHVLAYDAQSGEAKSLETTKAGGKAALEVEDLKPRSLRWFGGERVLVSFHERPGREDLVREVRGPDGLVLTYEYDAKHRPAAVNCGNVCLTRFSYDEAGRLAGITEGPPSGGPPEPAPAREAPGAKGTERPGENPLSPLLRRKGQEIRNASKLPDGL
ncbi:MAG: RHS repeat protein [Planctomycetes bacterium]|nr:RHS repeat protein [Planctomycetota bacterium]